MSAFPELRVSLDIGSRQHSVAVGLADGSFLEAFDITHTKAGFDQFFRTLEKHELRFGLPVAIAMEGFDGYARPLDQMIRARNNRKSVGVSAKEWKINLKIM